MRHKGNGGDCGLRLFLAAVVLNVIIFHGASMKQKDKSASEISETLRALESLAILREEDIYDPLHFLFIGRGTVFGTCNSNSLYHTSNHVKEGAPYLIYAEGASDKQPVMVHLCISQHPHYHTLKLRFINNMHKKCNAVVSATVLNPDVMHWDWRVREQKQISIHTYSREFLGDLSGSLVISITGFNSYNNCTLEIIIEEYPNEMLVSKFGLRGKSGVFYTGETGGAPIDGKKLGIL